MRSTTSQDRLSGLVTLSVEKDRLNGLSAQTLAGKFTQIKVRRVAFK